jgi:hypothetical protein
MIFFNLFTIAALAIWTPVPWWIILPMFFCWAILDLRVPDKKIGDLKIWRKKPNFNWPKEKK